MFKHIDDMAFIELPHRQGEERPRRNAINSPGALWPNARIPYVISSSFSGEAHANHTLLQIFPFPFFFLANRIAKRFDLASNETLGRQHLC